MNGLSSRHISYIYLRERGRGSGLTRQTTAPAQGSSEQVEVDMFIPPLDGGDE